jgi:hypothetical protein
MNNLWWWFVVGISVGLAVAAFMGLILMTFMRSR